MLSKIYSRQQKQTKFSDEFFAGVLRVKLMVPILITYKVIWQHQADHSSLIMIIKAPITTAADDKFCVMIFSPIFDKNKVRYYMRIVCQQTILMKYQALFVIFEKGAKFEIVACCKL